jgi:hypothetical protein
MLWHGDLESSRSFIARRCRETVPIPAFSHGQYTCIKTDGNPDSHAHGQRDADGWQEKAGEELAALSWQQQRNRNEVHRDGLPVSIRFNKRIYGIPGCGLA